MENLSLSAGVVVPLMVYMLVGFLIRITGVFSRENFKALNQMLFRVLIPLSLFNSIRGSEFSSMVCPEKARTRKKRPFHPRSGMFPRKYRPDRRRDRIRPL